MDNEENMTLYISTFVHSHSKWHSGHKEQRSNCAARHNKSHTILHHIIPLKSYYLLNHHLLHLFRMCMELALPALWGQSQLLALLLLPLCPLWYYHPHRLQGILGSEKQQSQ